MRSFPQLLFKFLFCLFSFLGLFLSFLVNFTLFTLFIQFLSEVFNHQKLLALVHVAQVLQLWQIFASQLIHSGNGTVRNNARQKCFFLVIIISTETTNTVSSLFFVGYIEEFLIRLRPTLLSELFDFIFSEFGTNHRTSFQLLVSLTQFLE